MMPDARRAITSLVILLFAALPLAYPGAAQLTPDQAESLMGRGINLGNTLEPPFEGGWNNGPAREYFFDDFVAAGFETVRIPVRWDEHTQDQPPFEIDAAWLDRVDEVLGWALERDLFVIVNAHHDDWVKSGYDQPLVKARLDSIWSQIATRFADAPERLMFEILNEPFGMSVAQVDEMNQRILDIIRRTNPTRIVIFSGNEWSGPDQLRSARVPDDDYLMAYYHSYDPWEFAGLGNGTWGSESDMQAVRDREADMRAWSNETGVPVMHSEFGAVRSTDYNSRMRFYAAYVESMMDVGIPFQVWDDGGNFGIYDRPNRGWDDDVRDILIHTYPDGPTDLSAVVQQDTVVALSWQNRSMAFAGLTIERAKGDGPFEPVAEVNSGVESIEDSPVEGSATYRYRVIARDALRGDRYSYPVRIEVPAYSRSGFGGVPSMVPGSIEAENYDVGGEGLTYHDSDARNTGGAWRTASGVDIAPAAGGYLVTDIEAGEWLEYSIDVSEAGLHRIRSFVSSASGSGLFYFGAAGDFTRRLSAPQTGDVSVTAPVDGEMNLPAGESILRLTFLTGGEYAVDRFDIDRASATHRESARATEPAPAPPEVFPNPVVDEMVLRLGTAGRDARAVFFDTTGRSMLSARLRPGSNRISVATLPPGTYVIRITRDGLPVGTIPIVVL